MVSLRTWHHGLFLGCSLLLAAAGPAQAEQCATCGDKYAETFIWLTNAALPTPQPVCVPCSQLPTRCSICRLPVKKDFLKLEDGRLLCPLHARTAVLTLDEAQEVFRDAKRELMRLLRGCGTTPDRNITVVLVAGLPELEKLAAAGLSEKARAGLGGFIQSSGTNGDLQHIVYLLSGQPRARLMAVGAHEYAHAWINENVPADRQLDSTNAEAFCELIAFKVMSDLREETEKNVILDNPDMGVALAAFVRAEERYGLYRITQWVQAGLQPRLDPNHLADILALKQEATRMPAWTPATRTPVPDTLRLKGISGRAGHWLALVNNQTLVAGETGRVRVGSTNVQVRCISVTEKSAVIELPDSGERQELTLESP
jgi:hypothetical protein